MATRLKKATVVTDLEARTVAWNFTDGRNFVAELSKLGPIDKKVTHAENAMIVHCALHGLKQKLSDTYAGDVADPFEEVAGMFEELTHGEWSTRQPGEPRNALVVEALARMHGISIEASQAKWDAASDADKKGARAAKKVKEIILQIQAERLAKAGETPTEGNTLFEAA